MLNEPAQKWVAALRSGRFKQTISVLHNVEEDGYCCLGVLCRLYQEEGPGDLEESIRDRFGTDKLYPVTAFDHSYTTLPTKVTDWVGLSHDNASFYDNALTSMNDRGSSFEDIANIIESEPAGLFVFVDAVVEV
jgi:hypothetical protein